MAEATASAKALKQDDIWPLSKSTVNKGMASGRGNQRGSQGSGRANQ